MEPTDNAIFKCLVFGKRGTVSFTFVMLSIEVLHGFIVQKAVGMYAPGDDISIVHLPAKLSPPAGQDDGGNDWGTSLVCISNGKVQTHCMRSQRLR